MGLASKKRNEMWRMRNEGGEIFVVDGDGGGFLMRGSIGRGF